MKFDFLPFGIRLQDKYETINKLEEFATSKKPITLERKDYETVTGRVKRGTSESQGGYAVVFQTNSQVIEEVIINI